MRYGSLGHLLCDVIELLRACGRTLWDLGLRFRVGVEGGIHQVQV